MKTTTEIEVYVSGAKIVEAEVRSDGTAKLTIEIVLHENKEEVAAEVTTERTKVSNVNVNKKMYNFSNLLMYKIVHS